MQIKSQQIIPHNNYSTAYLVWQRNKNDNTFQIEMVEEDGKDLMLW